MQSDPPVGRKGEKVKHTGGFFKIQVPVPRKLKTFKRTAVNYLKLFFLDFGNIL